MIEAPPVVIVLDHVKPENTWRIPDTRGGNTYNGARATGADGREREHQDDAAEIVKQELESLGVDVDIKTPEDFGNYQDYDIYIRSQSLRGNIIIPLHFDAEVGKGGVGFLTRVRPGDIEDKKLADRIDKALFAFYVENQELGNYRNTDFLPNMTLNVAAPGPATLVEMGSMVAWEQHYGKTFTSTGKFRELARLVAESIVGEKIPPVMCPSGWS
tara:strand:- start:3109 stop:3753 length:645 start_codon:yes stop_codon:yes gene_type:complete